MDFLFKLFLEVEGNSVKETNEGGWKSLADFI